MSAAALHFGTFSLAARCARTGQLGVITSTAALAGGAFVPYARPGIGAVATQALTNPYLGTRVLQLLEANIEPQTALKAALHTDEGRHWRQVAVVDRQGRSAAWTGEETDAWAGHRLGPDYAAVGNILAGPQVIEAMQATFLETEQMSLAERLMRALETGQAAGGDRRGRKSAALFVVESEDYGLVNLRVDDHPDPVTELRRIFEVYCATLAPVMPLFPSKTRPSGEMDQRIWEQRWPSDPQADA